MSDVWWFSSCGAWQRSALLDAGFERHGSGREAAGIGQDLVAELVALGHRRDAAVGYGRHLAGEAEALAHAVGAELHRVVHRRRRDLAGKRLHPARPAPAATSAGRGDLDAGLERRIEHGRSARDDPVGELPSAFRVEEGDLDRLRHCAAGRGAGLRAPAAEGSRSAVM
jgi:hypothetical protein